MKKTELLIIGQGPAGLSAAIYAARANIKTTVIGLSPKIDGDYPIDNYFGFADTINGKDLMQAGREQAKRFQAEIITNRVLGVYLEEDMTFKVKTESEIFNAQAVIFATGISKVRPNIANLDDYDGKGVSYCVSCDGFFFKGKQVTALGEGVYAASQALELLNYTDKVALCTQGKKTTITPEFIEKLKAAGIPVLEKKIAALTGEEHLTALVFEDGDTFETEGLFVALGEASASDFSYALGLTQNGSFIQADTGQCTNLPGVYAAGDCVGRFLQISVAVGEGAIAARQAIKYIKSKKN